jgi:hypothetical protein
MWVQAVTTQRTTAKTEPGGETCCSRMHARRVAEVVALMTGVMRTGSAYSIPQRFCNLKRPRHQLVRRAAYATSNADVHGAWQPPSFNDGSFYYDIISDANNKIKYMR